MINVTEAAAYAAFELVAATIQAMIEDGEYYDAMERLSGPTAEADRFDHMQYANGLVEAHNQMLDQFKRSHSIFGVRTAKMQPIDYTFAMLA